MDRPLIVTALGILVLWGASGQSLRPSFQVASIKPAQNVTGISITPRHSGNRVTYVTEVRMIVYYAYHVAPYQVSGELPNGVYDIQAVADGSPADDELRLMFQQLLEDRFRLKLHTETRQTRAYELIVAKDGPRLKPTQDGSQVLLDGRVPPEGAGAYATLSGPRLVGRNASMAQLAETLARSLQGPVVDRTGLIGTFDFNIAFSRDDSEKPADAPDVASAPTLAIAIQEQLGLKLQSGKAPVQILVIDHVSPPTDN